MRLTNNRFYCDYNATAPLSAEVGRFLASSQSSWGSNPAAQYTSGRKAKSLIHQTTEYLQQLFSLPYWVLYHSGATEGANFFFQGRARFHQQRSERALFVFASTDHPCVYQQQDFLRQMGQEIFIFPVDQNGQFCLPTLIAAISAQAVGLSLVYLNYTWVNNETGVVWELEHALAIKKATGCWIHVDGAQAIGKIANWQCPLPGLDAYTFSGHKLGALPGVAWTFLPNPSDFFPLFYGGGQQRTLRPGTENVLGIYSLKLALEELVGQWDYLALYTQQQMFEAVCREVEQARIVANNWPRAANTTCLLLFGRKGQDMVNFFDREGIEIGSGAACASGSGRPSRVLLQMGFTPEEALGAIRFSFAPTPIAFNVLSELTQEIQQLLRKHMAPRPK